MRSSMAPIDYQAGQQRKVWAHTAGMDENPGKASSAPGTVLSIHTLAKVNDSRPYSESPALITETKFSIVERERVHVSRVDRIAHKATGGMSEEADHEEESEVVGVPEYLESLLPNLVMSRRVHKDHDEKHKVSCYTTGLRVVDLLGKLSSQFLTRHEG